MRNKIYSDGSPSREWEDDDEDWETSGEEEVAKVTHKLRIDMKKNAEITRLRDRLINLASLVSVCVCALTKDDEYVTSKNIDDIGVVLLNNVNQEIKSIEQELKTL